MKPEKIPVVESDIEPRPNPEVEPSVDWRSYYTLFLLGAIYLFSSVDRTLISVLAEPIKREFALSDSQLGLLTGIAFAVSYSLAGIPMGMLVDRVKRTRLLSVLVTAWSGLTVLSGMATSAVTLALARIGVGTCEAGASPASMSIIADLFPARRRGLAMSLFYMSTPISLGITFALGGWLASNFGWRSTFLFAGAPGILLAVLMFFTVREPRRGQFDLEGEAVTSTQPAKPGHAPATGEPRPSFRDALRAFFGAPYLLLIVFAAICVVVAQAGIGAFISPFLIRVHSLSIEEAGFLIGGIKAPTGIAGILVGGLLADKLSRNSQTNGLLMVAGAMLVAGPLAALAMLTDNWPLALVAIAGFNFLNYTYYGATFATYISLCPVRMRGVLGGIFATSMTFGGYGFGPPLVGLASDLFAARGVDDPIRFALVFIGAFFSVGGILFLLAVRSIRTNRGRGTDVPHPA